MMMKVCMFDPRFGHSLYVRQIILIFSGCFLDFLPFFIAFMHVTGVLVPKENGIRQWIGNDESMITY